MIIKGIALRLKEGDKMRLQIVQDALKRRISNTNIQRLMAAEVLIFCFED